MKVASWYRTVVTDDPETDLMVHWSLEMLKKSLITAAAALVISTGATALRTTSAEAGVTIQLTHGNGYGYGYGSRWGYRGFNRGGYGRRWGHNDYRRGPHYRRGSYGPRFRTYGAYYGGPSCFTKYKKVKVRRWSYRKNRWVMKKIKRPVTICR